MGQGKAEVKTERYTELNSFTSSLQELADSSASSALRTKMQMLHFLQQ